MLFQEKVLLQKLVMHAFSQIPLGTIISCIELRPGQGAVMARSAGAFAQLMARDGKFATVKLPSGETRLILETVWLLLELYQIQIINY